MAGDIFEVKRGMEVYATVSDRFIYHGSHFSRGRSNTVIKVGDILKPPTRGSRKAVVSELVRLMKCYSTFEGLEVDRDLLEKAIKLPVHKSDRLYTSVYVGEYVVVEAGRDDEHSWYVHAQKLRNGKLDPKGRKIWFYQAGCYSVVHPNIPVIRRYD